MSTRTRGCWVLPSMAPPSNSSSPAGSAWLGIAAVVLAALAAVNVARTLPRVPPPPHAGAPAREDAVLHQERRLAPVRQALRAAGVQGKIGYIADLPGDQLASDQAAMQDYFLAQFVLAPAVLDARSLPSDWAVLNLRTAAARDRMPPGFAVARDCGGGVWLLHRASPVKP
jgi:hypothetical protein